MPTLDLPIDADAYRLLRRMDVDWRHMKSFHDRWENGGWLISVQAGGRVYSFFNHPHYYHWAKTTSSFGFHGFARAEPGVWAAAACSSGFFGGDKAFYEVCDEFCIWYLGMSFVRTDYCAE